ncbi:short chain dehydrogenase [Gammaproteobacteria bacterium 45_16_T64]|nr:short chain dehydrogenase [Gammaproteobacteria bacterium 45_16_T64]
MSYFITGATGFLGRFLMQNLVKREGSIYVLVRQESAYKIEMLREELGVSSEKLIAVVGDLAEKNLGVSDETIADLKGNIQHFFHLAAVYDLTASEESQVVANMDGTKHAIGLAESVDAGCFHHTSSIAAAGMFSGIFREDMFEEAEKLDDPYLRTKHDSEGLVRSGCKVPYRIYRPAMVVGHSKTGEMDKIDGPYFFFQMIKKLRSVLPPWMPMVGIEGGRLNIVPVDYVVDAMDHIAHTADLDGKCFHLTDTDHYKVGEAINIFAKAGNAPQMSMRIDKNLFGFVPPFVKQALGSMPPVQRIINMVLNDLGIPKSTLKFTDYRTRFDNREARAALDGSGISCPSLLDYAPAIWDYWARNLDPDNFVDRTLEGCVGAKVVVVTGATSGIGKAAALKLGEAGAKVVLAARTKEKLQETKDEIEALGGEAYCYSVDVSDMDDCDRFCEEVLKDFGKVDILVNNAGRSIRRAISASYDRFHDFERTMQLNYFGALRLMMNLLPEMESQRSGQVINISSIGVLTNAPRFSAYVASKSALDAFTRCAASEFSDEGVKFTTINMPLVRTPMIAPTKIYENVPTISPEEAADMICEAIIYKPKRIATRLGIFAQVMGTVAPKMTEIILNTGFRMFPDSTASKGAGEKSPQVSSEQVAFAYLMRGIHW